MSDSGDLALDADRELVREWEFWNTGQGCKWCRELGLTELVPGEPLDPTPLNTGKDDT